VEFPHLVKMHEKYAKDGLVAMSLNLDDPTDEKTMKRVREFLTAQKANFTHFVLDEEFEVWQKKLEIVGPPVVFVFGRDGKVAKKFEEVDYKEVEKMAAELLKK
jgi:hypothetical protein